MIKPCGYDARCCDMFDRAHVMYVNMEMIVVVIKHTCGCHASHLSPHTHTQRDGLGSRKSRQRHKKKKSGVGEGEMTTNIGFVRVPGIRITDGLVLLDERLRMHARIGNDRWLCRGPARFHGMTPLSGFGMWVEGGFDAQQRLVCLNTTEYNHGVVVTRNGVVETALMATSALVMTPSRAIVDQRGNITIGTTSDKLVVPGSGGLDKYVCLRNAHATQRFVWTTLWGFRGFSGTVIDQTTWRIVGGIDDREVVECMPCNEYEEHAIAPGQSSESVAACVLESRVVVYDARMGGSRGTVKVHTGCYEGVADFSDRELVMRLAYTQRVVVVDMRTHRVCRRVDIPQGRFAWSRAERIVIGYPYGNVYPYRSEYDIPCVAHDIDSGTSSKFNCDVSSIIRTGVEPTVCDTGGRLCDAS